MRSIIFVLAASLAALAAAQDDEPLVRCKRPMCKMFCDMGFKTDEVGCPTCNCLENPCSAIKCSEGEMCKPKKCETHPCTMLVAGCYPREDRPLPCAVPMCANECPFGYAKNERGCDTCNCNSVKPLCEHVREVEEEKLKKTTVDSFSLPGQSPEEIMASKANFMQMILPQCEEDGSFRPRQCSPLKGACWCVDDRGAEIAYTRQQMDGDEEEDEMPQCEHNRTTAIHISFKMSHQIPTENIDQHLTNLRTAVHAHLSHWMMIEQKFIEIIAVYPDRRIEHILIVEFIVERDGQTDLPSAAHFMSRNMREGKCKLPYKDTELVPMPETVTMKHKFDKPTLPSTAAVQKPSWVCRRVSRFYHHHRVLTILAAVGGVVLFMSITGVLIWQCSRKRRSASMQFSHKRLETMENFKQNLVLDFENHPDLTGEKKEKLGEEPVLVSSVTLDDGEKKVSLA